MKSRGKVFLLDDDELIVSMLSRALKKAGYRIKTATETHEIINHIKSFAPDVVLLDITMPNRNGMDILEEIIGNEISTQVVMLR